MRSPERQTFYLVGTSKSKISQHEKQWLDLPWHKVRESVEVKLYAHENELYVLAKSEGRQQKEIAMRRRKLVRLLLKLRAMRHSLPSRDQLGLRIGAAKRKQDAKAPPVLFVPEQHSRSHGPAPFQAIAADEFGHLLSSHRANGQPAMPSFSFHIAQQASSHWLFGGVQRDIRLEVRG